MQARSLRTFAKTLGPRLNGGKALHENEKASVATAQGSGCQETYRLHLAFKRVLKRCILGLTRSRWVII